MAHRRGKVEQATELDILNCCPGKTRAQSFLTMLQRVNKDAGATRQHRLGMSRILRAKREIGTIEH